MDVILTINGRDFSKRLSTYTVVREVEYAQTLITLDGTEHCPHPKVRDTIQFSLLPYDDSEANNDYDSLTSYPVVVDYTIPQDKDSTRKQVKMRVTSSIQSAFGLRSINGKRYYKGGVIVLRAIFAQ